MGISLTKILKDVLNVAKNYVGSVAPAMTVSESTDDYFKSWEKVTALQFCFIFSFSQKRQWRPLTHFYRQVSCGYGCMIDGSQHVWNGPNFQKYGNVSWYTDTTAIHYRNTAKEWSTLMLVSGTVSLSFLFFFVFFVLVCDILRDIKLT